ncbi:MAG TPA: hypothetical protein VK859_14645, partial [bacterium]|nr:hypothetical protein [bacterium]
LCAAYIPMRIFLKSNLLQGHFPLWCPYLLGGQPFFADPNTMAAYPLTYFTLLFPVPYGFGFFYFLHFLLAALGMHFWLKVLGLSADSRRVGSLLFALSGFFGWEIIHPPLLAAFAWMPWWGATLEKVSEKLKPHWAFAAGLVFALLFLCGNFQMTLGALYGGGSYLLFRLLSRRKWREEPEKDRRLLLAPLFFLWGALPLLVLWIPAKEFIDHAERLHAHLDYEKFQADLSLDPRSLLQLLFPVNPFASADGQPLPVADYLGNAGYLGPWVLFLSAWGLLYRKPFLYFLATAALSALLVSFGKYFPLHYWLCRLAPGFEWMRAPFRYLFLYCAGGSILAAFGHEFLTVEVWKKAIEPLRRWIGPCAFLYGSGLLALGFWKGANIGIQSASLLLGIFSFWRLSRMKKNDSIGAKAFLAVLLLSLPATFWFCASSRWGSPSNFDYASRSPILSKFMARLGFGRALLGGGIPYDVEAGKGKIQMELPPDAAYATDMRIAFGYNPLSLDSTTDLYTLPPRTFIRLMGIKAYVTADDKWKIPGFSKENWGDALYGQNQEEAPFVYSPQSVMTIADDQQRLAVMRDPRFVPYAISFLSEKFPESLKNTGSPARLDYRLIQDEPDEQVFEVGMDRPGWVVFSEIMYPGWKGFVDGAPTSLLTANHTFRALWMPAGRHEAIFRYEPWWRIPLVVGLGLWILSVLALAWGPWGKGFFKEFQEI